MIIFKEGVRMSNLQPQAVVAICAAYSIYQDFGHRDMTVTSCNDSRHSATSLHYSGNAFDLRTHNTGEGERLANQIRLALPALDFDVIFEGEATENEHIHIEHQPRGGALNG